MKVVDEAELQTFMTDLENIHETLDHVNERTESLFSEFE